MTYLKRISFTLFTILIFFNCITLVKSSKDSPCSETPCQTVTEGQQHTLTFNIKTEDKFDLKNLLIENADTKTPVASCNVIDSHCILIFDTLTNITIVKDSTNEISTLLLILYNVSRNKDQLNAEGKWKVGSQTFWFLQVISKAPNFNCQKELCNDVLILKCLAYKVYPTIDCKFHSEDQQMSAMIFEKKPSCRSVKLTEEIDYFDSLCSLELPVANIIRKNDVLVFFRLFPDVLGEKYNLWFTEDTKIILNMSSLDCKSANIKLQYKVPFRCEPRSSAEITELIIEKDDELIAICKLEEEMCSPILEELVNIQNNVVSSDLMDVVLSVKDISNNNLNMIGHWKLKHKSKVFCSLFVINAERGVIKSINDPRNKERGVVKSTDDPRNKEHGVVKSIDEPRNKEGGVVKSVDDPRNKECCAVKSIDEPRNKGNSNTRYGNYRITLLTFFLIMSSIPRMML